MGSASAATSWYTCASRAANCGQVKRRAQEVGLPSSTCCHTFRATGITAYLENGGTIENAQVIAAHESPRTTKLYDRTSDEITLDEGRKGLTAERCFAETQDVLIDVRRRCLVPAHGGPSVHAEQGLLTFVFGPSSPEAARQSAHAAAATARHWIQTDGGVVELRRAGSPDVQQISAATSEKELEQTVRNAVLAARDADPASFLNTLDSAAQAAALYPGLRVVVAVLNSPSFSSEGERTLEHLKEICQAHGVRVLVLEHQFQRSDRVLRLEIFSFERVAVKKPIAHNQRPFRRLRPELMHHYVFRMHA